MRIKTVMNSIFRIKFDRLNYNGRIVLLVKLVWEIDKVSECQWPWPILGRDKPRHEKHYVFA